ncbi:ABC transporter ATP-binding protein [Nocardioides sp. LHD-245]|uniref:ABC transporter ATP-binding protein n=1 Tax=Nocardioides sp. LHD-245 TaxID=3051387 RepID=UPI0027E1BC93|nr:ABC transporter ATP-binding protein [Nocardioides sp. LHD-245]
MTKKETAMTEPRPDVLVVDELVAGYVSGVDIIRGASLSVAPGELVGVIGPNGAGKSTFMKAMFGLAPVRGGSIRLDGEDIVGRAPSDLVARGVAYVPQTNNVFPSMTIEENLRMGLYQQRHRWAERFDAVTAMLPFLAARRRTRAGLLSGGERQMVALGRALMTEPKVLLLDEPSAGLSPINQGDSFERVMQINAQGVTIVMVEQNAQRCLEIVHRGYVLDQGCNAYAGTGRELLGDPKVVELYLGSLSRSSRT